jgi:hypothetical protein
VCLVHFMLRVSWPQPAAVGTLIGLDQDLGGTSASKRPLTLTAKPYNQSMTTPHHPASEGFEQGKGKVAGAADASAEAATSSERSSGARTGLKVKTAGRIEYRSDGTIIAEDVGDLDHTQSVRDSKRSAGRGKARLTVWFWVFVSLVVTAAFAWLIVSLLSSHQGKKSNDPLDNNKNQSAPTTPTGQVPVRPNPADANRTAQYWYEAAEERRKQYERSGPRGHELAILLARLNAAATLGQDRMVSSILDSPESTRAFRQLTDRGGHDYHRVLFAFLRQGPLTNSPIEKQAILRCMDRAMISEVASAVDKHSLTNGRHLWFKVALALGEFDEARRIRGTISDSLPPYVTRIELAEAMYESGDQAGGLREIESAISYAEARQAVLARSVYHKDVKPTPEQLAEAEIHEVHLAKVYAAMTLALIGKHVDSRALLDDLKAEWGKDELAGNFDKAFSVLQSSEDALLAGMRDSAKRFRNKYEGRKDYEVSEDTILQVARVGDIALAEAMAVLVDESVSYWPKVDVADRRLLRRARFVRQIAESDQPPSEVVAVFQELQNLAGEMQEDKERIYAYQSAAQELAGAAFALNRRSAGLMWLSEVERVNDVARRVIASDWMPVLQVEQFAAGRSFARDKAWSEFTDWIKRQADDCAAVAMYGVAFELGLAEQRVEASKKAAEAR